MYQVDRLKSDLSVGSQGRGGRAGFGEIDWLLGYGPTISVLAGFILKSRPGAPGNHLEA